MPIDDCRDRLADEQTAFHQLFVKNQRQVFAYILTLLPRMSDAEEVFQQACVVILGKASQFKASQVAAGADFFRWACQIAKYEVYNYRRRRATQQVCFSDALLDQLAARRLEGGRAGSGTRRLAAVRLTFCRRPTGSSSGNATPGESLRGRWRSNWAGRRAACTRPSTASGARCGSASRGPSRRSRKPPRPTPARRASLRPAPGACRPRLVSAAQGGTAMSLPLSIRDELHALVEALFEERARRRTGATAWRNCWPGARRPSGFTSAK